MKGKGNPAACSIGVQGGDACRSDPRCCGGMDKVAGAIDIGGGIAPDARRREEVVFDVM